MRSPWRPSAAPPSTWRSGSSSTAWSAASTGTSPRALHARCWSTCGCRTPAGIRASTKIPTDRPTRPEAPMTADRSDLPHLVVIGGGFAGLWATRALAWAPVRITLVDRSNHHLFQPLLYQVATAGLSAPDIAAPLRHILRRQRNVEIRLGEVDAIDPQARSVTLADGEALHYDYLLLATGATHAYFGNEQWAQHAPGLKSLDDALELRRKLLLAFERAEACDGPAERAAWLDFAIVGGGPTGVELAGPLAEIARHTLRDQSRNIDPASARVRLIEAGPRVLASFPEDLSETARRQLEKLGVEVSTGVPVTAIDAGGYRLGDTY